jgi:NitT/TauT family transport system permease protein
MKAAARNTRRNLFWILLGAAALLALWELAARIVGTNLLLPGPRAAAAAFIKIIQTPRFLASLGQSFLRVLLGIAISAPLGIAVGIAASLDRRIGLLIKPLFTVISATPVMSVILIAFLWFGQDRTPVFTAFLMVFPVMAANTMAGVRSVDPGLRELFAVYQVSRRDSLRYLYLPGILPFVLGGLRGGLSLCWKVVVAAEVLVQPFRALGTGMQNAKSHLETPELFAWTAATVIAAALSQFVLTVIVRLSRRRGLGI